MRDLVVGSLIKQSDWTRMLLAKPGQEIPHIKAKTSEDYELFDVIGEFNKLMREGIQGPDCLDPAVCSPSQNCCSIHIDIPPKLAWCYVKRNFLREDDLLHAGPFGFQLGVDPQTIKCVLMDPITGGCRLHFSGLKPPQCWVYPTGFEPGEKSCKQAHGWTFPDPKARERAHSLFEWYNQYCLIQGREERQRFREYLQSEEARASLATHFQKIPPWELAGIRVTASFLLPMRAEGTSLYLKKFCKAEQPTCDYDYLTCEKVCVPISQKIAELTCDRLSCLLNSEELTVEYSFMALQLQ